MVEAVRMVVFGDGVELKVQAAPASPVNFMLVAGAPFGEPIVPYGPFVMNTVEEIQQALTDLRNGTFVSLKRRVLFRELCSRNKNLIHHFREFLTMQSLPASG